VGWVDFITNPDNILTAVTAIVVFFTIVTVVSPAYQRTNLESRLKSVANRRE